MIPQWTNGNLVHLIYNASNDYDYFRYHEPCPFLLFQNDSYISPCCLNADLWRLMLWLFSISHVPKIRIVILGRSCNTIKYTIRQELNNNIKNLLTKIWSARLQELREEKVLNFFCIKEYVVE
jgi:hypothetical protein